MTKLLTMDQTSERTLAPVDTLRYWRQKGKGPHSFKIGKRVVYRESDVEAWINEQAAASAS